MAKKSNKTNKNSNDSSYLLSNQLLLELAKTSWSAEEVNSSRIASRANLVLSAILALIGLKLFLSSKEIDAVISSNNCWIQLPFIVFSIISIAGLLIALCLILNVRSKSNKEPASNLMTLAPVWDLSTKPTEHVVDEILAITNSAAIDLYSRNKSREAAVSTAQSVFVYSAFSLLIALIFFTIITVQSGGEQAHECDYKHNQDSSEIHAEKVRLDSRGSRAPG